MYIQVSAAFLSAGYSVPVFLYHNTQVQKKKPKKLNERKDIMEKVKWY